MTDVKLSFVDLQRFLIKDMKMQANYQPIMIRTLLNSPQRTATKDEIAEKIRDLNSDANNKDFKNISVYYVLTSRGIVKRDDNKFLLNIEELSNEQTYQLSVLCNWKTEDIPLQNQIEDLIKAFDKNRMLFNPDRSNKQDLEKLRTEFVSDYSVEKISKLKLDEYVTGKPVPNSNSVNKSTFCYRLENKLDKLSGFGIRKALDFGIYYNKEKQKYVYQKGYSSEQEIFDKIKTEITNLLEAGRQYHTDHDSQQLLATIEKYRILPKKVRSKILSVYYPEDFLHIHSFRNIQIILETFGIVLSDIEQNLFLAQIQLLEIKKAHPIMSQWSIADFSHFVWTAIIDRFENEKKGIYNYLLLLQQPNSKWNDKEGEAYEFGDNVFNYQKVVPGVFVIFRQTKDAKGNALNGMNFFGHGKVSSVVDIVQDGKTLEGKDYVKKIAHITDYKKLEIADSKQKMIESKIRNLPNFNRQNAIITIPEDLYQFIVEETNIVESNEMINVFVTGYNNTNVKISKEHKILGWKNKSQPSIGDRIFVYNTTSKKIECGFKIQSKSNIEKPIWYDEINSEPIRQIYKHRWDAELVCDNLNIGLEEINQIPPFKADSEGKRAKFGILVLGDAPNSLTKPIYKPFRDYLLSKCDNNKMMEQKETDNWSFDNKTAIEEILVPNTENELAIKEELVERILNHLKSGKNVILVGPPGVGKTDLSRRILKTIGKKVIDNDDFMQSVASDEWSRFDVIGGLNLDNKFQEGWITKAINEKKWLLIDEFNRANMNKAFGEMFLGLEYNRFDLKPSEVKVYENKSIEIPKNFRMICTMNDFDKNLLLSELSYGLISRFAFVSITPDTDKEVEVVKKRVKTFVNNNIDFKEYEEQINTYFNFINDVRKQRNIGVRTSIDVIKYLITSTKDNPNKHTVSDDYKWLVLNDALCDYVLPQFDRLDGKTIKYVLTSANKHLKDNNNENLKKNNFDNFINELEKTLDRLQKASEWLSYKNDL